MAIGRIILDQEASIWQDAMPIGNGTMGALIFGSVRNERMILNHENLWLPVNEKRKLNKTGDLLPEVRRMAAQGKYKEIAEFWYENAASFKEKGLYWPNPFQPGCELQFEMEAETPSDIQRNICFETGEALIAWKEKDVTYNRKCFVSRKDNIVVYEITTTQPSSIRDICINSVPYEGEKAWDNTPIENLLETKFSCKSNYLFFECNYTKGKIYGSGYGALARIITDGKISTQNNKIQIDGFKKALILIRIYDPETWQKGTDALKSEIDEFSTEYKFLLERHVKVHGEIFNRCSINLFPEKELLNCSASELLVSARESGKPSRFLIQLMYEYGRYLIISSTGSLPANLQGVWNGSYNPPWQCDYTMDENIQMNYWQVMQGNMPELLEAYFSLFEMQRPQWRENAKEVFSCSGVLAPIKSTIDALPHHISPGWPWHFWTAGAGWIASLYYDYYLFTNDEKFLKERVIPFLIEIVDFYVDYLVQDDQGYYCFIIGISPENTPDGHNSMLAPNPTMEIAVAREVLIRLIEGCRTLNLENDRIPSWQKILSKLPEYMVNSDGVLKEWLHPDYKDNYHHRHQSHIYPLFPGFEAMSKENRWLFDACRVAVDKRLVIGLESQTGWSLMHMACIFARLGWAEKAFECLRLETIGMVGTNLFTYHDILPCNDSQSRSSAKFQIDANFGMNAAIQEMLLFSMPGYIAIIPALPDEWPQGSIRGMKARGGITLDMDWDMEYKHLDLKILSDRDQTIKVIIPFQCEINKTNIDGIMKSSPWEIDIQLTNGKCIEFNVFGYVGK